jgi:hypothetical protein
MTSTAARPHITAAGLILNEQGHILIVSHSYKAPLGLPGGIVRPGESPHAARSSRSDTRVWRMSWKRTSLMPVDLEMRPQDREGDADERRQANRAVAVSAVGLAVVSFG